MTEHRDPPLPVELFSGATPSGDTYIRVIQQRRWERVRPGEYVPVHDEFRVLFAAEDHLTEQEMQELRALVTRAIEAVEKVRRD